MNLDFDVRPAASTDAPDILHCLAEAFAPYRSHYTSDAYAGTVLTAEALNLRMRRMTVLVAVTPEGAVVGTVALDAAPGSDGHIRGMAVLHAWQGYGVAARLLHSAEALARTRGCLRLTLDTTEPLHRAIAFYRKHGYAPTGLIVDFFGMPLYEYAKRLPPG